MLMLLSHVKRTGSERSISNLLCVCEPICNSVPVAAQHLLPPCAGAGFPTLGSLLLLYSLTLSLSVYACSF